LDAIVLATSTAKADDQLDAWAMTENVPIWRGSEDDVLSRVVDAQSSQAADVIVEITGDCTLIDPEIVDLAVATFRDNDCDVVTNARKPSYPLGADVQVYRLTDLVEIERTVRDPAVREHVSLFFYEHPERYRVLHLMAPPRWRGPEIRLQLDYPEDLLFIREIYSRLETAYGDAFGLEEIMALLRREPSLTRINAHCQEKPAR
jgi:spore coat polysaccharide biosynthesis protein SpsF